MPAKRYPRPSQVRVGNHIFSIEWLSEDEWTARQFEEADGLTFKRTQDIAVKAYRGQPESALQAVLLHEIQHAIWSVTYLDREDLGALNDAEEHIFRVSTDVLLGVLKGNPTVVAYLTSDGDHSRK